MRKSILALVIAAFCAFAQQTATLTGFITDPSASSLTGAKVTAVNTATQFVSIGETNET